MKRMKALGYLTTAALSFALLAGTCLTAQASTLTEVISSANLHITYDLEENMTKSDVTVTTDTDGVTPSVVSISGTDDGDKPVVKIKLSADTDDGYYFDADDSSLWKSSSAFTLSGYDATYKSSFRSGSATVYLYVTLPEIGTSAASYRNDAGQPVSQQHGWVRNSDNSWSFMKDDNTKQRGWVKWNDKWYFLNDQGVMQTGWIKNQGQYYYLGQDGAMYLNQKTPDGYFVGSDGAWQR